MRKRKTIVTYLRSDRHLAAVVYRPSRRVLVDYHKACWMEFVLGGGNGKLVWVWRAPNRTSPGPVSVVCAWRGWVGFPAGRRNFSSRFPSLRLGAKKRSSRTQRRQKSFRVSYGSKVTATRLDHRESLQCGTVGCGEEQCEPHLFFELLRSLSSCDFPPSFCSNFSVRGSFLFRALATT